MGRVGPGERNHVWGHAGVYENICIYIYLCIHIEYVGVGPGVYA